MTDRLKTTQAEHDLSVIKSVDTLHVFDKGTYK